MDQNQIIFAVVVGVVFLLVLRAVFKPRSEESDVPPNAILVDGSNVMHWGGDPSIKVLRGVLRGIEKRGFSPVVVFDASVGYRLSDRYLHGPAMAKLIDLPKAHVYVVQKGVVADEVILDLATIHELNVVSNDRYRDWSVQFPLVKKKGRMMRGAWKGGAVVWTKP